MNKNIIETATGFFVLAAAIVFAYFVFHQRDRQTSSQYTLIGLFAKAEGVQVGSDVRLAGVKIGQVNKKSLDPKNYESILEFSVDINIKIPKDSLLRITSDGIFGDSYLSFSPGKEQVYLADGQIITNTQAGINFIDLVGQAIFKAAEKNSSDVNR